MKIKIKTFTLSLIAINAVNFLASITFRINRFIDQYSWWIKRGHKNYLGKDQSLFNLITSVFLDYCFVIPFMVIVLLVAIGFIRNIQPYKGIKKGMMTGLLLSGALSSVFIALYMIPRFSEILQDGTAEWAMAWLPFIWLGYPSLIVGAVLGILIALIHKIIVCHKAEKTK
ncbi:hypothetical protein [Pontiella sulfatireligans]|uniref:Uncharacterized protein n=1 Tax=Pontiella sulfatireligans TaxID=2750658 RepID=A0A6C2UMY9_9BACT|nr:hypothetical protein [Pontiella sulfatireligans]VGO21645.1 hypothetical protein SCARR_03719 [Pontiella sulfatireligans]